MATRTMRAAPMNIGMDGDLWIPRTMWEKRRQLSGVVHRCLSIGRTMLVMSCDDWTTFKSRIDAVIGSDEIEYLQVTPSDGVSDLSRVLGSLVPRVRNRAFDLVLVDDVDMILDLRSEESAVASMFALLYALKARFNEIILFANPVQSEYELDYLTGMRDFLRIHAPVAAGQQNVA